jgi:hypothetical protein
MAKVYDRRSERHRRVSGVRTQEIIEPPSGRARRQFLQLPDELPTPCFEALNALQAPGGEN